MRAFGRITQSAVVAAVAAVAAVGIVGVQAASAENPPVMATYNGGTINLSQGWGSATVCEISNVGATCFATQSDYQSWITSQENGTSPLTECSSKLELYQNEAYGGDELVLSATLTWINLTDYSFANEVSSYKVGSCDISMTDGANGSGDVYPGATSAGSDVPWIGTAWNDRVQSVYIY